MLVPSISHILRTRIFFKRKTLALKLTFGSLYRTQNTNRWRRICPQGPTAKLRNLQNDPLQIHAAVSKK